MLSVKEHEVILSFSHEDQEQIAVMTPGKMFISGSENLLNFAKSQSVLNEVFSTDKEFFIHVKKLSETFTALVSVAGGAAGEGGNGDKKNGEAGEKKKREKSEIQDSKTVSWGVTLFYTGAKPEIMNLKSSDHKFDDHNVGWQSFANKVCTKLLSPEKDNKEEQAENTEDNSGNSESWFLVNMQGVNPSNIPVKYPAPLKKKLKGQVKEIHRPFGGVIDVGSRNGGKIAFHRNVVVKDGVRLGITDSLEHALKVGQQVIVDIVRNADDKENIILHDVGDKIASNVFTGDYEEHDEGEHPEAASYGHPYHRVRVVELYEDPESGMITHGLGCIQYSQFIKNGMASASMVGEFVSFKREDFFFYGVKISSKVDLSHLLNVGDEIKCHLKMLDTKLGRAQFFCKIGWVDSVSNAVIRSHMAPENPSLHKWCIKKGLDWATTENIVLGGAGVKKDINMADMAVGTIIDLEPAENNETVAKGLIKIEVGPHKDKVVRFTRTKASLFGMKLDQADLLYIVRPYDRVYCEISGIADYPQGQYMSQKVQFHKLFPDQEVTKPETELPASEKIDFIFWMNIHHNTFSMFQSVLAGSSSTRYFIPFPRDSFPGRVVSFDPPKSTRYSMGCTSGTIVLDYGSNNLDINDVEDGRIGVKDMKEVKVTFHRASFWIYGRKMAKADLSYVVQPNQRVMVECKKITDEDRRLHTSLPADIDYRATIIWIGPSRPRNDRDDPNRSDPGIFSWLSKRGMNIGQFTKLVEGRVPAHTMPELDHNGFFLPPVRGEGASMSSMEMMTRMQMEQMPVLR